MIAECIMLQKSFQDIDYQLFTCHPRHSQDIYSQPNKKDFPLEWKLFILILYFTLIQGRVKFALVDLKKGYSKRNIQRYTDKHIQLFSEKCTGRYFNVRDDDLSSKQGSLCTLKLFIFIYLYLL